MKRNNTRDRLLQLVRRSGVVRARELRQAGVAPVQLRRLLEKGQLVRYSRGLYSLPEREPGPHFELGLAARRVPDGVICLLSALAYQGLTSQSPHQVWLAVEGKHASPRLNYPPLRLVRMSGPALSTGVERHVVDGAVVRVTSRAKTVADLFKFRNKVGLDVALEALRDFLRLHPGEVDELSRMAQVCRVQRVLQPYLEALS
jgi:predicted transcriptional regulator of viral defense system